ncbi:nitric oxide associated protein 1 [Entomortierella chlamydospora]|nr:nitric oxide associated protein 1 [Entomortierella chlamydospora]
MLKQATIPWTRSTTGAECLFRTKCPVMVTRCIQTSNCRAFSTRSLVERRLPTTISTSGYPRFRNAIQSTQCQRSLSAAFSTCGSKLLDEATTSTASSAKPTKPTIDDLDRKLRKLVGVPCPGCGSPFQMKHQGQPGYLTRMTLEPSDPKTSPQNPTEPPTTNKPAFDSNATSMSHAQYEEHLKSLDPKILEEMGITAAPTGSTKAEDGKPRRKSPAPYATKEKEVGEEAIEETILLDRKPKIKPSTPPRIVCHRCHSLLHHSSPLGKLTGFPSVLFPSPPAPVPKHIATLKQSKTATVVLVLDLVDFPLSLPEPVVKELLKATKRRNVDPRNLQQGPTPIIVVGNKFDIMPRDTQRHKLTRAIRKYFEDNGLAENVKSIHILSAKNPAGDEIRMLLKSIASSWHHHGRGNVVMVGAENVGKSQLLNAILRESGRWRPGDLEVMSQKQKEEQLERKKKLRALLASSSLDKGEDDGNDEDGEWDTMTGRDSVGKDLELYKVLYTERGLEKIKLYEATVSNVPGTTLEKIKIPLRVLRKFLGGDYKDIDSKWLMDTPGIRNSKGELTNWLTLDELKVSLPKRMLKPASFLLEEGRSFFLGGLVRIDCISIGKGARLHTSFDEDRPARITASGRERGSNPGAKLTVFTSLPLHITSTERADAFLQKTAEGELTILQPPFGSPERLKAFPGLAPALGGDLVVVNQPFSSQPATRIVQNWYETEDGERHLVSRTTPQPDPFSKLSNRFDSGLNSKHWDNDFNSRGLSRKVQEEARLQLAGQFGICDLVFSGVGWVMVSGKFRGEQQAVKLRVWTPKGVGAGVREICFVPELADNPLEKTAGGIRQNRKIFARLPNSSTGDKTTVEPKDVEGEVELKV